MGREARRVEAELLRKDDPLLGSQDEVFLCRAVDLGSGEMGGNAWRAQTRASLCPCSSSEQACVAQPVPAAVPRPKTAWATSRRGRRHEMISAAAAPSSAGHGTPGGVGAGDQAIVDGGAAGTSAAASSAGCAHAGVPQKMATASTSSDARVKRRNIRVIVAWI